MSNVKHKKSSLRTLASDAKKRLVKRNSGEILAPKGATPRQKEIFLRLIEMQNRGESVVNPIDCFADKEALAKMSPEERQRFILQLAADYASMKEEVKKRAFSNS